MERKTLIALVLSLVIFVSWQKLYMEPQMAQQALKSGQGSPQGNSASSNSAQNVGTGAPAAAESGKQAEPTAPTSRKGLSNQVFPLVTPAGKVLVGNGSLTIVDWVLDTYRQDITSKSPHIDLKSVTHELGSIGVAFEDTRYSYLNEISGTLAPITHGVSSKYSDQNLSMVREVTTYPDRPYVDLKITTEFKAQPPRYAFISLNSQSPEGDKEEQDRQLLYWSNQTMERVALRDIAQREIPSAVHYIAATNRYFLMALVAQGNDASSGLIQSTGKNSGRISMVYPVLGNSVTIPLRVYFGPKELETLRSVDVKLDHSIDFGWFTVFAYPLLKILKWFFGFFQNYGVAIILLTVLLKLATYPLTYKSMKSMKKMAKLQPQLQKIREKYKDDKEALNREMLSMMKTHGYNPMAGCVPILIQMPIFFALYRVLYSSIELYHAPFTLWIQDLSSRDPFYVTPVLLALTMFVQQKLTPNTATDPAQARMMQLMPLIFGAFMLTLPSGLTVYMLVNSLASILQQMILNKKLDGAPAR